MIYVLLVMMAILCFFMAIMSALFIAAIYFDMVEGRKEPTKEEWKNKYPKWS